jgi:hypothetical protein
VATKLALRCDTYSEKEHYISRQARELETPLLGTSPLVLCGKISG